MSLGQAVVEISGDTSQLAKDAKGAGDVLQKAFGGAARKAISNLSSTLSGVSKGVRGLGDSSGVIGRTFSRLGDQLGGVFSGIGSVASSAFSSMVSAAEGAAAAITGVLGAALVSGWKRMTTLEDSAVALEISLGDAGAAGDVLADVLDVVTGTPYNLDQFSAAAQQMVGMGIEANKVPGYLRAIGEASATQGSRAGEFASRLSTVFGQITASSQVSLSDIWRISDTGVNALAILGNHFGVTTDEMKKMVSAGAVPATEALDALSKGILEGSDGAAGATQALEGTMEGLRQTLSGAFGGFKSSLAQLGAGLLEPFREALTTGFNVAYEVIGSLKDALSPIVTSLAESPGFQKLIDFFESLPEKIGPAISKIGELGPVAGAAGAAFAALGSSGIASLLGPFGAIIPTINPILAAFAGLVAASPELREAFGKMFETLQPALESVMEVVGMVAGELAEALVPVVEMLADALGEIIPIILEVVEAFLPLLPILIEALTPVIPVLAKGIEGIARVMRVLAPIIAKVVEVFAPFAPLLLLFMGPLPQLIALIAGITYVFDNFGAIVEWIGDVISTVAGVIVDVFMGLWNALYGEVSQALNSIVGFFQALPGRITGALSSLGSAIAGVFSSALSALSTLVSSLINGLITIFVRIPVRIVQGLGSLAQSILGVFQSAMSALLNFVTTAIGNLIRFYAELPGRAVSALSNLGSSLLGVFQNAFSSVRSYVSGLIDEIVGVVTGLPGRAAAGLANLGSDLLEAVRGGVNRVIDLWNGLELTLGPFRFGGQSLPGPLPDIPAVTVGPWTLGTPNLPHLAEGGILTGPTLAMMAEAGDREAVIPLNTRGAQFMQEVIPPTPVGFDDSMARSLAAAVATAVETRPTTIELQAVGNDRIMDEIMRGIRQRVQRQGGNVQMVLGGSVR